MRDDIRRVAWLILPADEERGVATAIGAGIGLAIGVAVCPYCANEGAGGKYTGPLTAIGAGAGAVGGFLRLPYRTVYQEQITIRRVPKIPRSQ